MENLTALSSAVAIVLAIEKHILVMYTDLYLANWTAGGYLCHSAMEHSRKARAKQMGGVEKLVDKAERHFDIDLSELTDKKRRKQTMAKVELLAPKILKWEGGFVNDPLDATNKGDHCMACGYDKDGDGDIDVDDMLEPSTMVLKRYYWDQMARPTG